MVLFVLYKALSDRPQQRRMQVPVDEVARLGGLEANLERPSVNVNGSNIHPHVPAPSPLNDIRRAIQERLDALEIQEREIARERLELNSRWNRSLVVTQLPNELLFHIFVCFSEIPEPPSVPKPPSIPRPESPSSDDEHHEDDEDGRSFTEFGLAAAGWTKLMLVCRRWCDVARATPALWRAIAVGRTSEWMNLALARSGTATIDVSFRCDFSEEHASLLKPHCYRLRSFRLRTWSLCALQVIRNTLPALETLEIHRNSGYARSPRGFYPDLEITRQRFPNLRTLQLVHTLVPMDPLFYAPLRKLSLKQCPFKTSFEQFAQLLSRCPCLEDLELDEFLHKLSDNGNLAPPRSLPSLLSLRLNNHTSIDSARFLSHIVVPQTASLSVTACIGLAEGDTLRAVVPPNFATSLPGLTAVTWARLVVTEDKFAVEFERPLSQPGREETLPINLTLTSSTSTDISWEYRMPDGLADLRVLLGATPLTHLEVVGNVVTVGVETWTRLFQAFPSLVSLEAGAIGVLFDGLHEASVAGPADEPVACRRLESIAISDCWAGWGRLEQVLNPLIHCLRYRLERGARLKKFTWQIDLDDNDNRDVMMRYLSQVEDLVPMVGVGDIFTIWHPEDNEILDGESEESEDGSDGSDDAK